MGLRVRVTGYEFQIHMNEPEIPNGYNASIFSRSQKKMTHTGARMLLSVAALLILSISPIVTAATLGTATGTLSNADPPLNPTAYAAFSGDYNYTAAGAAMRNQGYGNITVTWTGTLFKAYLVWAYINYTATNSQGTFNGQTITGTLQSTDYSPCWVEGTNVTVFAADVTSLVKNGDNHLTDFPSGLTTGENPWDGNIVTPLDEGASLIVIYTPPTTVHNQVYVYTGTYTNVNQYWELVSNGYLTSVFNHGATTGTTATTTFIVSDGQLSGNPAEWDKVIIDSNAFPGTDPRVSSATWSKGNLWDTKTYSVPVTIGSTQDNATIGTTQYDCITWAAQVLSFPSLALITPPPVSGVPQFGVPMLAVATGFLGLAFLAKKKSSLSSKAS
jgi:hypothetical protein